MIKWQVGCSWAITPCDSFPGLKWQKSILSQLWRSLAWNGGVCRCQGRIFSWRFQLPVAIGRPSLVVALLQSLSLSHMNFFSLSFLSLRRTVIIFSVHPNPVWSHLNLYPNYIYKESISKIRPHSEVLSRHELFGGNIIQITISHNPKILLFVLDALLSFILWTHHPFWVTDPCIDASSQKSSPHAWAIPRFNQWWVNRWRFSS